MKCAFCKEHIKGTIAYFGAERYHPECLEKKKNGNIAPKKKNFEKYWRGL